jgi:uncharacterized protein
MANRSSTACVSPSSFRTLAEVRLKEHFLQPLLRPGAGALALRNDRTARIVATVLEQALDSSSRKRGLLGRGALDPERALIIAPSNMVHTFGMQFPIDLLFVTRDGRVLKAPRAVPARRIVCALRAFAVIELAANILDRSETMPGDRLSIVPA